MGKTFHSKYEFKKLAKGLSVRAAKAKTSRHPNVQPGRPPLD